MLRTMQRNIALKRTPSYSLSLFVFAGGSHTATLAMPQRKPAPKPSALSARKLQKQKVREAPRSSWAEHCRNRSKDLVNKIGAKVGSDVLCDMPAARSARLVTERCVGLLLEQSIVARAAAESLRSYHFAVSKEHGEAGAGRQNKIHAACCFSCGAAAGGACMELQASRLNYGTKASL